jgi:hypothetical protein
VSILNRSVLSSPRDLPDQAQTRANSFAQCRQLRQLKIKPK